MQDLEAAGMSRSERGGKSLEKGSVLLRGNSCGREEAGDGWVRRRRVRRRRKLRSLLGRGGIVGERILVGG